MLNLLYKDSVGVGLDASSSIHFVNVELFNTATTFTTTKDAGTNIAAQMGVVLEEIILSSVC